MVDSPDSKSSSTVATGPSGSSFVAEPQSFSGKPMNDSEHNVPNRDAGNPPDPTLPTPNQSPVQPSAKEIDLADREAPHVDMGVRHEPGPVKHNPGAGTVEEGMGTYDTESNCPDASYLAGDCSRSENYYKNRGLKSREEILAEREAASKASGESK